MKHYVAYSAPEGGHNTAPAHLGRREVLTTFVPPFAAGMEAGALAMMVSYNEIDGEPNAQSNYLLTQIPREQVGGNGPSGKPWDGYVSSDFGAISKLVDGHKVVPNSSQAIAQYIKAGGSVQGFDFSHQVWHDGVLEGVASGALPEDALDLAVARVLKVKARLGLLDQPFVKDTSLYHTLTTSKEHEDVALVAARKAMCLLQNELDTVATSETGPRRVLPLSKDALKRLAVVGPNADQPQCGDYAAGGSWGGDKCGGGPINNNRTISVIGGIKTIAPDLEVTYAPGVPVADYNTSAPYFTTIQAHSFTTDSGARGIIGKYYRAGSNINNDTVPVLTRNDYMISFHLLNYGPGQSEADPTVFPESSFSAVWEGFLTPDCTVEGARFMVIGRGTMQYALYLDAQLVLNGTDAGVSHDVPVDTVRGKKMKLRFEYSQPDNTGNHPAWALQWSLQGGHALQDAVDAVHVNDATVAVVGGGTSVTSGEGDDRASMALPGAQLAFIQAVYAAAVVAKKPFAVR